MPIKAVDTIEQVFASDAADLAATAKFIDATKAVADAGAAKTSADAAKKDARSAAAGLLPDKKPYATPNHPGKIVQLINGEVLVQEIGDLSTLDAAEPAPATAPHDPPPLSFPLSPAQEAAHAVSPIVGEAAGNATVHQNGSTIAPDGTVLVPPLVPAG